MINKLERSNPVRSTADFSRRSSFLDDGDIERFVTRFCELNGVPNGTPCLISTDPRSKQWRLAKEGIL